MRSGQRRRRRRGGPAPRGGFTLVELLVVIGIIAMLISILLPTLAQARRAAYSIKCSANVRSIVQAMHQYANMYNGGIPGSAWTTGAHLYKPGANNHNCPRVSHINDWQAPIATVMGIEFNEGGTLPERVSRFTTLMNRPEFVCPENDVIAGPNGAPSFPATQWNSYVTAVQFMYKHNYRKSNADSGWDMGQIGETYTYTFHDPPPGYAPKITKVGTGSRKVFIACGGKYSSPTNKPAMPLTLKWDWGGTYADRGPWYRGNTGFGRHLAPGNGGTGVDSRIYSYRHGIRGQKGPANAYKFTVGFYDGHVELMGDLEGADPRLWNPEGTRLEINNTRVFRDVKHAFYNNVDGVYAAD